MTHSLSKSVVLDDIAGKFCLDLAALPNGPILVAVLAHPLHRVACRSINKLRDKLKGTDQRDGRGYFMLSSILLDNPFINGIVLLDFLVVSSKSLSGLIKSSLEHV